MGNLHKIRGGEDLRSLSLPELIDLAQEIRDVIIDVVSKTGGHMGASLGVVELTIALHRELESPRDLLVWDVGHQGYVHKLLTGRLDRFPTLRQKGGISGFLKRDESPHDQFGAGHASTAISAALGMATARDLKGDKHRVVAVVGDGAMTGGLAYEGLNNAGHSGRNMMVVLNDNRMSISPNVGAMSRYLSTLITNPTYNKVKAEIRGMTQQMLGDGVTGLIGKMEEGLKNLLVPGILFEELGFRYFGPIDGHDLSVLLPMIANIKDTQGPVLLHVLTQKGKGHPKLASSPDCVHGVAPPSKPNPDAPPTMKYQDIFGKAMCQFAEKDPKIVAITAAMESGTGLTGFHKQFPDRFFDVGIAEEHAVTFAGGLATQGIKPVAAIYSTFLQRAFDQIIHDVGIQELPVIFALDRAGFVGDDGETHHGIFDLAYFSAVPNYVVSAPKDGYELVDLLRTGLEYGKGPFAVRFPRGDAPAVSFPYEAKLLPIGKWEVLEGSVTGSDLTLLAVGTMVKNAHDVAKLLAPQGIDCCIVNCRFVKPMDMDVLREIATLGRPVFTIEEAVLASGFGSNVSRVLFSELGMKGIFQAFGVPQKFIRQAPRNDQLEESGLLPAQIASEIRERLDPEHRLVALHEIEARIPGAR
ncbi:MAG: 1-deoxy-D-xylulose-5-phosphate synthase [Acidobacteriota bacterium]